MTSYDATGPQKRAITKLAMALGVKELTEEEPMTSGDAGKLIRKLYSQLRVKNSSRKLK